MCSAPMLAVKLPSTEPGKFRIKFLCRTDDNIHNAEIKYGKERVLKLPCGECADCKATYAFKWSKRCLYELLYHDDSCFITLTYDDEHNPGELVKRDYQLFLKKLRKKYGEGIKVFLAGEYGSHTFRPHFHAILFGYCPKDLKPIGSNGLNQKLYESKELSDLWQKGYVSIGEVSKDSCSYVAGYTAKKDNPVLPGFIKMSKGLGRQFVIDHAQDFINNGCAVVPGIGVVQASRYEFDLLENLGYSVEIAKKKAERLNDEKFNTRMLVEGHQYKDQLARQSFTKNKRKRGL